MLMVKMRLLSSSFIIFALTSFEIGLQINAQGGDRDLVIGYHDYFRSNPVILVPGDGGSQLEARLNKTTRPHYICSMVSDWFNIWLNIHLLTPITFDCVIDNLKLQYDSSTHTTFNTPGVQVRPRQFGQVESVEYLDAMRLPKTGYFSGIVANLEKVNGLVRDHNMFGAPYDFRKAPNELELFFQQLEKLIELSYVRNNYRPATLICHSMGCLNMLYFLNDKDDNWKKVHIKRLIALGSPWGGSIKAVTAMLSGDNLGMPLLNSNKLQALQSTFPSLMYLFPRVISFDADTNIIESPDANYTIRNLESLFPAVGLYDQLEMYGDTMEIASGLEPPNVELWCIHGSGYPTVKKIVYENKVGSSTRVELTGDGDGSVNLESLRTCERFSTLQEKPVFMKEFKKMNHIDMIRGPIVADYISNVILRRDQDSMTTL